MGETPSTPAEGLHPDDSELLTLAIRAKKDEQKQKRPRKRGSLRRKLQEKVRGAALARESLVTEEMLEEAGEEDIPPQEKPRHLRLCSGLGSRDASPYGDEGI
jgi:hypothetical protein